MIGIVADLFWRQTKRLVLGLNVIVPCQGFIRNKNIEYVYEHGLSKCLPSYDAWKIVILLFIA